MIADSTITVISLIVAAIAVFVGPIISWFISKRTTESSENNIKLQSDISLKIANKQIIAPMRQAWINSLRDLLAELLGKCEHYWLAGFEERDDQEYLRITELENKLKLFINPSEDDHKLLISKVRAMTTALVAGKDMDDKFWNAHKELVVLSQKILKTEWNVTKNEI